MANSVDGTRTSSRAVSPETREDLFREFMQKLLRAQQYDFMEPGLLFSRETLNKTLNKFCDIIAEHLGAQSCTIHLQLYDPKHLDDCSFLEEQRRQKSERLTEDADGMLHVDRIVPPAGETREGFEAMTRKFFTQTREKHMCSTLTFPYWEYSKGAARLVAANANGPWWSILQHDPRGVGLAALSSGVTADIVQDNTAKVRDRLSIRATRNTRKLGSADTQVWTNWDLAANRGPSALKLRHTFANYYGVPIRIHSGGEVVGILKVENKGFGAGDTAAKAREAAFEQVLGSDCADVVKKILAQHEKWSPNAQSDPIANLEGSLLGLAYLEADLAPHAGQIQHMVPPYPQTPMEFPLTPEEAQILAKAYQQAERDREQARRDYEKTRQTRRRRGRGAASGSPQLEQDNPKQAELTPKELRRRLKDAERLAEQRRRLIPLPASASGKDAAALRCFDVFGKQWPAEETPGDPFFIGASQSDLSPLWARLLVTLTNERHQRLAAYQSLRPANGNPRPPIQVFTDSLDDERKLWKLLRNPNTANLQGLWESVGMFYRDLRAAAASPEGTPASICEALRQVTCALNDEDGELGEKAKATCFADPNSKLPDFSYQFDLTAKTKADPEAGDANKTEDWTISLHVVVPPTKAQLRGKAWCPDDAKHRYSRKVNKHWLDGVSSPWSEAPPLGDEAPQYRGEAVTWGEETPRETVVDLLVDRLAARVQALLHALPVEEFPSEDTNKLSWAALEIGKLVEREISYRANLAAAPMPLTAMEFYRLPISDLSFVDDLRERREATFRIKTNVDHYVKNTIHNLQMTDVTEYTSRVKGYGSYLARLSERHEGYIRGNLAIWLYLLALLFGKQYGTAPKRATDDLSALRKDLSEFVKLVNGAVATHDGPKEKTKRMGGSHLDRIRDFIAKHVVGGGQDHPVPVDVRFATPPFRVSESAKQEAALVENALQRIVANLACEHLIEPRSGNNINTADDVLLPDSKAITLRQFDNLIFRQYDAYATASASLLVQLLNLRETNNGYAEAYQGFYEACWWLRNFLISPSRDIAGAPEFAGLKKVFGETAEHAAEDAAKAPAKDAVWQTLIAFIEKNKTEKLSKMRDDAGAGDADNEPSAYLNITGVYKRIRNLNNTLRHQRPPAGLEWELRRFDLLGGRIRCPFKDQVFALYETLWNLGDPFFCHVTHGSQSRDEHKEEDRHPSRERQRWLCVRTKVNKEDGYHDLQIRALADPEAIMPDFWERPHGYNLRQLRRVLGRLFCIFESEPAKAHHDLLDKRDQWLNDYEQWYETAAPIMRGEGPPGAQLDNPTGWGWFVGAGAIEVLLENSKDGNDILKSPIWEPLEAVLRLAKCHPADDPGLDETEKNASERLYAEAIAVVGSRRTSGGNKAHDQQLKGLEEERRYFAEAAGRETSNRAKLRPLMPLAALAQKVLEGALTAGALERFRRAQRDYLLAEGEPGGLGTRSDGDVLNRIENYVLLFCPRFDTVGAVSGDDPDQLVKWEDDGDVTKIAGWTASDLFYYMRSLIPIEIQIRTELVHTMAEQYHDAVYKSRPPDGTRNVRKRLHDLGDDLDELDRGLGTTFVDYINRYRLSSDDS